MPRSVVPALRSAVVRDTSIKAQEHEVRRDETRQEETEADRRLPLHYLQVATLLVFPLAKYLSPHAIVKARVMCGYRRETLESSPQPLRETLRGSDRRFSLNTTFRNS
jgi:hypothetical protein